MKKQEIKLLLIAIADRKGIRPWITDLKADEIAEKISQLQTISRGDIRSYFGDISSHILETIDFSDIENLFDQIVLIVNRRLMKNS